MKKIIAFTIFSLIMITLAMRCSAQDILYGENWTNVPQFMTDEVIRSIDERLPVGETYIACFRNDKYAEDLIDIAPQKEIDMVIKLDSTLKAHGKYFKMVYTFDARGRCAPEDAFVAFDQFINHDISIPAVRFGNEEFSKVAGHPNFEHYQNFITPLISELQERSYAGKYLVTLGTIEGDKFLAWNNGCISFCASNPNYEGDFHFYFTNLLCDSVLVLNAKGEYALPITLTTSNGYNILQDEYYHNAYFEVKATNKIQPFIDWYKINFPGKKLWVTEFGPMANVGPLSNTLGYEALQDWFYNQVNHEDVFAAICKFNGPGTPTGCTSKRGKLDPVEVAGDYIKRLSYYTSAQFIRNKHAEPIHFISSAGDYTFSLHNMVRGAMDPEGLIPISDNLFIESFEYEYISGANYYSSSGVCQWWATGSEKTYEISGSNFSSGIPPLSYGYVHVTVKEIPVMGCTDQAALNYDADANTDDGSCYYFSDCGCKDVAATNYSSSAPCADNTKCTYPNPDPQVCYKQRLIFKFLGCKVDKDCKVNNCVVNAE